MDLASSARARNVRVIDEYQSGNLLRVIVRGDISESRSQCGSGDSGRLKKRVAVTGFPVLYPDQARVGRIDDAGEILPQQLQQRLVAQGGLQVFGATTSRMFTDLLNAPTVQQGDNRLTNVLELVRSNGLGRIVQISSQSVYGPGKYEPVDEGHPTDPDSPYGVTKIASEKWGNVYASAFGVDFVALRMPHIYGPGRPAGLRGNVIQDMLEAAEAAFGRRVATFR